MKKLAANSTNNRRHGWAIVVLLFGLVVIGASFIEPDRIDKLQDPIFDALDNLGDKLFPLIMRTMGILIMLSAPLAYFQWPKGWWEQIHQILEHFKSNARENGGAPTR